MAGENLAHRSVPALLGCEINGQWSMVNDHGMRYYHDHTSTAFGRLNQVAPFDHAHTHSTHPMPSSTSLTRSNTVLRDEKYLMCIVLYAPSMMLTRPPLLFYRRRLARRGSRGSTADDNVVP